jgi:hypothetical protein
MDITKRHSHPETTILLQFFNVPTLRNTDIQEITHALADQGIARRSQKPKFTNGFQKTIQLFVYRPRRIHSIPYHANSLRSIFVFSSNLRHNFQNDVFLPRFKVKVLYAFLISSMNVTISAKFTSLSCST